DPSSSTLKLSSCKPGINSPLLVVTITLRFTSGTSTCREKSGIPGGFLTFGGGGSGGASFFFGTASGPILPCGPPASGGGSCWGGFCGCCGCAEVVDAEEFAGGFCAHSGTPQTTII